MGAIIPSERAFSDFSGILEVMASVFLSQSLIGTSGDIFEQFGIHLCQAEILLDFSECEFAVCHDGFSMSCGDIWKWL